jgi:hypothetical protein
VEEVALERERGVARDCLDRRLYEDLVVADRDDREGHELECLPAVGEAVEELADLVEAMARPRLRELPDGVVVGVRLPMAQDLLSGSGSPLFEDAANRVDVLP